MANKNTSRVVNKTKLTITLVILAVVLMGASSYVWWHSVRSNPERTFWSAIDDALSTSSVTRSVSQSDSTQSQSQILQFHASPKNIAVANLLYSQTTGVDITNSSTDFIGTPSTDYVKYTNLSSSTTKNVDYSSVNGVWGRSSSTDGTTNGQLFNQLSIGLIPFANLNSADRTEIITLLKNEKTYQIDFSKVQKTIVAHRPTYKYDITMSAKAYATVVKTLAQKTGLTQLQNVSPDSYSSSAPVVFSITVDVWSRHITSISYPGGAAQANFNGYNAISHNVTTPNHSIPLQELQSKFQKLQK